MKKHLFLCLLSVVTFAVQAQQKIKDGTGAPVTSLPAAGSLLELQSTQAGLRMPQVALTSTIVWSPLLGSGGAATSPGMSVYNTNVSITGTVAYPAIGKGEYYWDGTGWVSKNAVASKSEWLEARFLGTHIITALNQSFVFTGQTISYSSPTNSITFTANSVTLQPGKTYLLHFAPLQAYYYPNGSTTINGTAYTGYQWFDNSTNLGVGQYGFTGTLYLNVVTPVQPAGQLDRGTSGADAIVSPTVATTYSVRSAVGYSESHTTGIRFTYPSITVRTLP